MERESVSPYRHVPNAITCLNLFCGCLSIVFTFDGKLAAAAYFILAAAVFDFFDGFAARWLRAYSDMGKELDSLADMVSFGVAPAAIMYSLLFPAAMKFGLSFEPAWCVSILAFVIAVFSALRLAKFNIDTRQSDSFIGLPTPANALFICSLALISTEHHPWAVVTGNMLFLLAVTGVFSYLLVAELPLFSLKFQSFDWKSNKIRYIFVIFSLFVLIMLQWAGLSVVILMYIVLSVFPNKIKNHISTWFGSAHQPSLNNHQSKIKN
jgi:CDP-diacylglycerol--serine O-phosphatidyltransferase